MKLFQRAAVEVSKFKEPTNHFMQNIFKRELLKQKNELILYKAAFLAHLRQRLVSKTNSEDLATACDASYKQVYYSEKQTKCQLSSIDCFLSLTIQNKYLVSFHNSDMLKNLHKIARNFELVFDKNILKRSDCVSLVSPNAFPIISTKESEEETYFWLNFEEEASKELLNSQGYALQKKQSTLQHYEAGDGLFLKAQKSIPPGTLIAFFPGVIYTGQESQDKLQKIIQKVELPYFSSYNGDSIFYNEQLPYPPYDFN